MSFSRAALARRRGVAVVGGKEQLAGQAVGGVAVGTGGQAVGQRQGVQRRDDGEHRRIGPQLLLHGGHLGHVVGGEQVVRGGARLHGEHDGHRVATEALLVVLVLDLCLVGAVEVAGVAGGKLQLGDPHAESHGDQQADERYGAGAFAQVEDRATTTCFRTFPPYSPGACSLGRPCRSRGGVAFDKPDQSIRKDCPCRFANPMSSTTAATGRTGPPALG